MKRWLWVWTLVLVVGIVVSWWLLHRRGGGPLLLVSHRGLPAGAWLFLGALSGEPTAQMEYTASGMKVIWLDSAGNPNYGTFTVRPDAAFSPNGTVVATRDSGKVLMFRRDGSVETVSSPVAKRPLSVVNDRGDFCDEGDACSVALPDSAGRSMIAPAACDNAGYLPVLLLPGRGKALAKRGTAFGLFNTSTHALRFTTPRPNPFWPQAVFTSGTRTACVDGKVVKVFDGGTLLATLPGAWRWCGDGTIWQVQPSSVPPRLEWRQGKPRLMTIGLDHVPPAENAIAQAMCNQGALLARVEKSGNAPQLVLYRHNKRLAAYRPPVPAETVHLALSPDGLLVYWVVRDEGGAEMFVLVVKGER